MDCSLAEVPVGAAAVVVAVDAGDRVALEAQGIRPGVRIVTEGDAPFGGPRIVRLGPARLAVARAIARTVLVSVVPERASR